MLVSWSFNWKMDLLLHDNHHWRHNPNFVVFIKGKLNWKYKGRRRKNENGEERRREKRRQPPNLIFAKNENLILQVV